MCVQIAQALHTVFPNLSALIEMSTQSDPFAFGSGIIPKRYQVNGLQRCQTESCIRQSRGPAVYSGKCTSHTSLPQVCNERTWGCMSRHAFSDNRRLFGDRRVEPAPRQSVTNERQWPDSNIDSATLWILTNSKADINFSSMNNQPDCIDGFGHETDWLEFTFFDCRRSSEYSNDSSHDSIYKSVSSAAPEPKSRDAIDARLDRHRDHRKSSHPLIVHSYSRLSDFDFALAEEAFEVKLDQPKQNFPLAPQEHSHFDMESDEDECRESSRGWGRFALRRRKRKPNILNKDVRMKQAHSILPDSAIVGDPGWLVTTADCGLRADFGTGFLEKLTMKFAGKQ